MLTYFFIAALLSVVFSKLWLAERHIRCIARHYTVLPKAFTPILSLEDHQHAANYTIALTKFNRFEIIFHAALLALLTVYGGLSFIFNTLSAYLDLGIFTQVAFISTIFALYTLCDLPFSYFRQFVIEEKFGFNRMTVRLFFIDLLRTLVISIVLGVPLLLITLWIVRYSYYGLWWLYAWLIWIGFNIMILLLYPTVIAPLFNTFKPLEDHSLQQRINSLLKRCGFYYAKGLFVMDGSRRSAHSNAYFTGFGKTKRIVFFDTLLARLIPEEIEAVLAHELGHFKHHHILQRILLTFAASLALLVCAGWLVKQDWFYTAFGFKQIYHDEYHATGLVLFFLILPVFFFFLQPLINFISQRAEFEADRFAVQQIQAQYLISALIKLYKSNASTLTPDPIYSAFYYSHPSAIQRIHAITQHQNTLLLHQQPKMNNPATSNSAS